MISVELAGYTSVPDSVGGWVKDARYAVPRCHKEVKSCYQHIYNSYDDSHVLSFEQSLEPQRVEDTETPLTGDDGGQDLRNPSEAVEPHEVVVGHEPHHGSEPFFCGELQVELLAVEKHRLNQVELVSQRQREQTQVDAVLQALFVEHRHVDDVGWPTDQEQDGQQKSVFQSSCCVLHFSTDNVVWVVPGQELHVFKNKYVATAEG